MSEQIKSFEDYLKEETIRIKKRQYLQNSAAYYKARKQYDVDENIIFYEAYFGRGLMCNPYALFQTMLHDERFSNCIHVWSAEDNPQNTLEKEKYNNYDNVIFVEPKSDEYFEYLSRAKYLINNVTFAPYFAKKEDQIIINTWHGIPLKHMGYDEKNGAISSANMVRNFLMTDYLLSASKYTTDLFKTAYKLDGLFEGVFVEAGSPRVDTCFNASKEELVSELLKAGVEFDPDKKLVLYAPTFKGNYSNPKINTKDYDMIMSRIENALGKDEYQVLFKPHQIVYKHLLETDQMKSDYIPSTIDINLLLGFTELLVTDYSSVFFDYLPLNKNILFYLPDIDEYNFYRGVYFPVESLPGAVCKDLDEVEAVLSDYDNFTDHFDENNYHEYKKIVCNEDGNASARVIESIFGDCKDYYVKTNNDKKKILFHTDVILKNGISSSALNLLNTIDTEKYDITFYAIGRKEMSKSYIEKLPPSVRVLYKNATIVGDAEDFAKRMYCTDNAITDIDDEYFPDYLYKTEYKRCFGDALFDVIIDFSGFSSFYVNILRFSNCKKKIIWMHNVMQEEYKRVSDGKKVFETTLNNIFKIYPEFDLYISCSETTMNNNIEGLEPYCDKEKFGFLNNSIGAKNIFSGVDNKEYIDIGDKKYIVIASDNVSHVRIVPAPSPSDYNFVTVGRLEDAKNHLNLIKAFHKLKKTVPNVKLYIIGDGNLLDDIVQMINQLNLEDDVVLTGNIENPFGVLSDCNCFVLPSYYEGQPMVILEARTLGLSIIESDFDTVKDSSYPGGQLIIGKTEEEIFNGLKCFVEGNVPNDYEFDYETYNKEISDKFDKYINA